MQISRYTYFFIFSGLIVSGVLYLNRPNRISLHYVHDEKSEYCLFCSYRSHRVDHSRWIKGNDILSDQALTLEVPGISHHLDGVPLLFCLDKTHSSSDIPDLLYADLNRNTAIDSDEKFFLKPGFMGADKILMAEKLPLILCNGGQSPFYINIHMSIESIYDSKNPIIGICSWGCMRGKTRLNGNNRVIKLRDYNVNGFFNEFSNPRGAVSDLLFIEPAEMDTISATELAKKIPLYAVFLKRKMIIEGKPYIVNFKERDDEKELILTSCNVESGKISAQSKDISIRLGNSEWGSQRVLPGKELSLPVGKWSVLGFERIIGDDEILIDYAILNNMKIDLKSDMRLELDFETKLIPKISAKLNQDHVELKLEFVTCDGSKLTYYENIINPTKGIPFKIFNDHGTVIENGIFKFG